MKALIDNIDGEILATAKLASHFESIFSDFIDKNNCKVIDLKCKNCGCPITDETLNFKKEDALTIDNIFCSDCLGFMGANQAIDPAPEKLSFVKIDSITKLILWIDKANNKSSEQRLYLQRIYINSNIEKLEELTCILFNYRNDSKEKKEIFRQMIYAVHFVVGTHALVRHFESWLSKKY